MNIAKAERGCLRAHPRATTYQLCGDCLSALSEASPEPRGPGRPQPTPSMREEILTALLADGCPHGCIDTCGFTVRITRMLAALSPETVSVAREP